MSLRIVEKLTALAPFTCRATLLEHTEHTRGQRKAGLDIDHDHASRHLQPGRKIRLRRFSGMENSGDTAVAARNPH